MAEKIWERTVRVPARGEPHGRTKTSATERKINQVESQGQLESKRAGQTEFPLDEISHLLTLGLGREPRGP